MKNDLDSVAGSLIEQARLMSGLTVRDLATRAHTSPSAISNYENAKVRPSLDTLMRVIEAAGLELRLEVTEPDEQARQYEAWEAAEPKDRVEEFYAALEARHG